VIVHEAATSIAESDHMNTKPASAQMAEGVRAVLATYARALDDGRTDDVVATYCRDGICAIPGMGTHTGHDELRAAYAKWAPTRPQRHLVFNTVVTEEGDGEATAVSDVVFLLWVESGWAIQLVGRYDDVLHCEDGAWRFHRRAATFVTGDTPRKGIK
jgi:3-phenylpropionate/cinnamic acid dioxygenase small subunit